MVLAALTTRTIDRPPFTVFAGGVSDATHHEEISEICGGDYAWMTRLDYMYVAVAVAERERWPRLGLSTTRRSLSLLCSRYNDEKIQWLACFI